MCKKAIVIVLLITLLSATTAQTKSLYVVAEHHTAQFDAWNIQAPGVHPPITYQATYNLSHAHDPAGVAIDNNASVLFITSENDPGVELVDATTMTSLGWAPGATNLGGIDIDDRNDVVYAVQRGTGNIYVYDWDPTTKTLTLRSGYPKALPNCGAAFGLALDEIHGFLYVADTQNAVVRIYDLATLTEVSSFSPSFPPVGLAVDRKRGIVYTTAPDGTCAGGTPTNNTLLSKYDLATGIETTVDMGHGGMGIAVDEVTGYVYVTGGCSGDDISVWDSNLNFIYSTGPIGNPAGIAIGNVSYNPLNLSKNDVVTGYGVYVGQEFTYRITFGNSGSTDVTGVKVVDTLPPELDFVSETLNDVPNTGVYDPVNHTVTWDIGTLPAGYTGVIELVVRVNQNAAGKTVIYNYCTIESDQTPPTTVIGTDPDNPTPGEPGTYIIVNQPPDTKIESADIDPVKGTATFTWSGTDDKTPTKDLVYSYRLAKDSVYSPWSDWSSATSVTYTDLEPGNYRFQVRAKDADGAIDSSPASWDFKIGIGAIGEVLIVPFYPRDPSEPSVIMEKGILHRYFKLLDASGVPIPGAKVYIKNQYLDPSDSRVSTTDDNGVFGVIGRADRIGPPGTKTTIQLIERIELNGQKLRVNLSRAAFPVEVKELWYQRELCTVNSFEVGVDLGPQLRGFGFTLTAASVGVKGGASISHSVKYKRKSSGEDTFYLQMRIGSKIGTEFTIGAKFRESGFLAGVTGDLTVGPYSWLSFKISDPLGAGRDIAEDLLAAYLWEKLYCEGLIFFPLLGPLMHCITEFVYQYDLRPYLDEVGAGWQVQGKLEGGVKFGFRGTHTRLSFVDVGAEGLIAHQSSYSATTSERKESTLYEFGAYIDLGASFEFTRAWARRVDAKKIFGIGAFLRNKGKWTTSFTIGEQDSEKYVELVLGKETEIVTSLSLPSFSGVVSNGCRLFELKVKAPFEWQKIAREEMDETVITVSSSYTEESLEELTDKAISEGYDLTYCTTVTDSSIFKMGFDLGLGFLGGGHVSAELLEADRRTYPVRVTHTVSEYPYLVVTEEYEPEAFSSSIWDNPLLEGRTLSQLLSNFAKNAWETFASALGYLKKKIEETVEGITEIRQKAWKGVKDGFHMVVEGGKDLINGAKVGIQQLGESVKGFLGRLLPRSLSTTSNLGLLDESATSESRWMVVTDGIIVEIIDQKGVSLEKFDDFVDLSLSYTDEQLADAGVPENAEKYLQIFWWNSKTSQWEPVPSTCNTAENYVEGQILYAGIYVVGLSNTPPHAEILSPQSGAIITSGHCSITWTVSDDQASEDLQVDLFFAPVDSSETWTPIAIGISNTGQYEWDVTDLRNGEYVIKIVITDPLGASTEVISDPFVIATVPRETGVIVAPNPVGPEGAAFFYSLPEGTATAELMIFDITGRLVFKTSLDVNATRFPSTGTWDPVDQHGVPLANGPYIYVLVADGKVIGQGKMVIQR